MAEKKITYKCRSSRNRNNCLLLFEKGEGYEFIVLDTETTGKDSKVDYIVEFSAIKYKVENHLPVEIDKIDVFIKPPFLMEEDVIKVHGITNEFLEDKPTEKNIFEDINNFLGANPIIAAYNGEFDIGFIDAMYKRQKEKFSYQILLDVLEMARDLVGEDTEKKNLETVVKYYGLDDDIRFHNGFDDVRATSRLFFTFYQEYKKIPPRVSGDTIIVNYSYFWKGMNKFQRGIYFNTNFGKIYLSTFQKCWCSTDVDLSTVDIDSFERGICQRAGISFVELARMTQKKFDELKKERKI